MIRAAPDGGAGRVGDAVETEVGELVDLEQVVAGPSRVNGSATCGIDPSGQVEVGRATLICGFGIAVLDLG